MGAALAMREVSLNHLCVMVVCSNASLRRRCLAQLRSQIDSGNLKTALPEWTVETLADSTLESASAVLDEYLAQSGRGAILISDLLAQPDEFGEGWEPTSAAKELRLRFAMAPFANIAIVSDFRRVPDVDHALWKRFDERCLLGTLKSAVAKLAYLLRPQKETLVNPVIIREIDKQREMREYFRLRYHVYQVMGYIEEPLLLSDADLEMDWCDTTAIHIGAFEQLDGRERLVGCARLVNTANLETMTKGLARRIARRDPILTRTIDRTFLSLRLPIFQSAASPRLKELLRDTEQYEKNCGELSRVIVTKNLRGTGLANLLVKFAIFKANEHNVDPLLLECLERHVPFYEKFGFRVIPGEKGRVVGIERSLVAMELNPVTDSEFVSGVEVYVRHRRLCACQHKDCYKHFYQRAGTYRCPLVQRDL